MRRGVVAATTRRLGLAVLAAAAWGMAGRLEGATACGTMITNIATATMKSADGLDYMVSYNATVMVNVLCMPVVRLVKWASTPLCAAGCTVTFRICVENQMDNSVWGITITDVLPTNMWWGPGSAMNVANYDMTVPAWTLGAVVYASGATTAVGSWVQNAEPPAGQGATWYMRWVIGGVGPMKSACVTYKARIL